MLRKNRLLVSDIGSKLTSISLLLKVSLITGAWEMGEKRISPMLIINRYADNLF